MTNNPHSPIQRLTGMRGMHVACAILVAAAWGANYVSSLIAMESFPPLLFASLRFALAAVILLAIKPLARRDSWRQIAALALTLGVLHMALMIIALNMGLSIAACVIVVQLGVPFSCLLGAWLLNDRIGPVRSMGLAVAFIGIIIMAGTPNILSHPAAFGVALVGTFFWGVSNIQIKKLSDVPVLSMLGLMSAFAAPMTMILSLLMEDWNMATITSAPWSAWASILYTVLVSTIVAFGLWTYLLGLYPVSKIAPFSLLVPVFGIAIGQICYSETLSVQIMIGGMITVIGVAVVMLGKAGFRELMKES